MSSKLKIACIQLNSSSDVEHNLKTVSEYLQQAQQQDVQIVQLPENFACMPKKEAEQHIETEQHHPIQDFLAHQAKQHQLAIIAGSVAVRDSAETKPSARCLVYSKKGEQVASYNKIHLYDVVLPSGEQYKESNTYLAGESDDQNLLVADVENCKIGLSICYDLRFPELYRRLVEKGANLLSVPAAFTFDTGKAHWQTLLQARAIESQSYLFAAAQTGVHDNRRKTWGHSMIISPWGEVLNSLEDAPGLLVAEIDLEKLQQQRQTFPVLEHRRLN